MMIFFVIRQKKAIFPIVHRPLVKTFPKKTDGLIAAVD